MYKTLKQTYLWVVRVSEEFFVTDFNSLVSKIWVIPWLFRQTGITSHPLKTVPIPLEGKAYKGFSLRRSCHEVTDEV